MALTDNLISYWKLDEASGNAADSHGSNTLINNGSTPFVAAKINNGADIEAGSAQYFSIADASQSGLDFLGDWSVSAWINVESFPAGDNAAIIGKDGATRGYFFLTSINDGGADSRKLFAGYADAGGLTQGRGNTQLTTATWYHVVLTADVSASNLTFYVNNSLETTTYTSQAATSVRDTSNAFLMGNSFAAGSNQFDGIIDELGIWSRILTSGEVSELYNSGSGLAYPFTTPTQVVVQNPIFPRLVLR